MLALINRLLIRWGLKCPCGAWKIFAHKAKIKLGEIIFEQTSKGYPIEITLRACRRCGVAYQNKNRTVKIKNAPAAVDVGMLRYYDGEHRESN